MRPAAIRLAGRSPRWHSAFRWVVAIVPVALLLFLVLDVRLANDRDGRKEHQLESVGMLVPADSSVVDAARGLVAFTLSEFDAPSKTNEQRYAAEGLRHVAALIEALARRDTIGARYASVPRELIRAAEELEHELDVDRQVTIVRTAFLSAAALIVALQEKSFPHLILAVAQVERAADRISAEALLSTQRVRVEEFFVTASDALIAMTWRSL